MGKIEEKLKTVKSKKFKQVNVEGVVSLSIEEKANCYLFCVALFQTIYRVKKMNVQEFDKIIKGKNVKKVDK